MTDIGRCGIPGSYLENHMPALPVWLHLGTVKRELLEYISDKDIQEANQDYVGEVELTSDAFAMSEPER